AGSRLIYSYARDRMIVFSGTLSRVSSTPHVPGPALVLTAVIPIIIVLCGYLAENVLTAIVSFAVVGMYIAFQMVVLAALHAKIRGWRPSGKFTLGIWGLPNNLLAILFESAAVVNLLWIRNTFDHWY